MKNTTTKVLIICGIIAAFVIGIFVYQTHDKRVVSLKSAGTKKQSTSNVQDTRIRKVTCFLENSGSMNGFVSSTNDYVQTISALAYHSQFIKDGSQREFYFINGKPVVKTFIGTNPSALTGKLNVQGFNVGNPSFSDLNANIKEALNVSGGQDISIYITDGIYDVGNMQNPLAQLVLESGALKQIVMNRLRSSDLQIIIAKMSSFFDGRFHPGSCNTVYPIHQFRPYYVFIIGQSSLLNKYFPESFFKENLPGYVNLSRFLKIDNSKVKYQVIPDYKKGEFRFDHHNMNKLVNCSKDKMTREFQFAIAIDFSSIPYSDNYFKDANNYQCSKDYKVIACPLTTRSSKIPFKPTHFIVVKSNGSYIGKVNISLLKKMPEWIYQTSINNDCNIVGNTTQTYGFNELIKGITDAYKDTFNQQYLFNFYIEINN